MKYFQLRDGTAVPAIGYGTYKTQLSGDPAELVHTAIQSGYRHIDTAVKYDNEDRVGEGIRVAQFDDDIQREDLFVTSKVWASDRGYEKTMQSVKMSLMNLELEYIDLYLIHWPAHESVDPNWEKTNRDTWQALIDAKKAGYVRNIGVSNFEPKHLKALEDMEEFPMVDQIEFHPGMNQEETREYCREHEVLVEAWSPMARGRLSEHPLLIELAQKYQKSISQICIRFCLQNDVLPLPKSTTEEHMRANLAMDDWEISAEDMKRLNDMEPCAQCGQYPETVAW